MDFNAIIKRVIGIITKPNNEWEVIKNESMTVGDMYTKYAIILAAIPAIAGFIGFSIFSGTFMLRFSISYVLIWAIITYIMQLVGVFLVGIIIDTLATNFGSQKNTVDSMKIAVFSFTPMWIAWILFIIPALGLLGMIIGGLYSLYMLYLGIKIVKNPPQDNLMGYFIVTLIISIIVSWLIWFIPRTFAFPHYTIPVTSIPVM